MSQFLVGKVKNVLNENTLVIVPSKTKQIPAPERLLTLPFLSQTGSPQCKEYLRELLISKEIKFKVFSKGPSGREFGDIRSPIFESLMEYLLENGMGKLKENISEESELIDMLRLAEDKARNRTLGLWDPSFVEADKIQMVELTDDIIEKSAKSPITMVTEKVINGDRLIVRILFNKKVAVNTPLLLAGLKCPRSDDTNSPANVLKVAQEAKNFVEEKLLTTKATLRVTIVGKSQTNVPIGIVYHSSGNDIHKALLENGYAEVVDWQSTMIGSSKMGVFRKAEQTAKALGKGLFSNTKAHPVVQSKDALKVGGTITHVIVTRVISSDTISVKLPNSDESITVQLASVRSLRLTDSNVTTNLQQQQALVNTAKEFVRSHSIGKSGTLYIDGYREANKDLGFDSRYMVSFKIEDKIDLSELIIKNGLGTVIRHNKSTQQERSHNWDHLLEIEEEAKSARKGIYYSGDINKIIIVGSRIVDASENQTKAKTFFNGFKQKGRIAGAYYVEFVSSVNRVKLFNPKEGTKLTLVLGGLANNKDQSSEEGLKFMNRKFLQRNVEFDVYDTDKVGNFIGNLYANSKALIPLQVYLLEQGFAATHELAVTANPFSNELLRAEDEAKAAKRGIWKSFSSGESDSATAKLSALSLEDTKPAFFDIEVTNIDDEGVISFQKIDSITSSNFEAFKTQFNAFHAQTVSASEISPDLPFNLTKPPKKGELVSVKFDDNGKYYRGRVVSYNSALKEYDVKHIDFGNVDTVPLSSLRKLPPRFNLQAVPSFSSTCVLEGLRLPPSKPTDYLTEALNSLEDLTYDKKLVISVLPSKAQNVDYSAIIYDADRSIKDSSYTINTKLVEDGYGVILKNVSNSSLKDFYLGLAAAQKAARDSHRGCWEFGDVMFDEEEDF